MKVNLIKIGNSRGIRIPKAILDECNFGEAVELTVKKQSILLKPTRKPREGWEESFRKALQNHPEKDPLTKEFEGLSHSFDNEDWEW